MVVLCLGAHPDDIEIGAGATIAKLIEQGHLVFGHCLTVVCKEYSLINMPIEMMRSFNSLGIMQCDAEAAFDPRDLPRQRILEQLIHLNKTIKPEIVFTHASFDTHQDHHVIHNESFRAFKHVKMLGYDMPWNYSANCNLSFFSKLDQEHAESKITALEYYKSQQHRQIMNADFQLSLMRVRGAQINTSYAEAFETIRWTI